MHMDENKMGETLWTLHMDNIRAMDYIVEQAASRGEQGVMQYLYHVARPMSPGELTEKLGLTTGRVANILKSLEASGDIVRKADPLDGRRVLVALTPGGEAKASARNREQVAFHTRLISALTPEEGWQFISLLTRMVAGLESRKGEEGQ